MRFGFFSRRSGRVGPSIEKHLVQFAHSGCDVCGRMVSAFDVSEFGTPVYLCNGVRPDKAHVLRQWACVQPDEELQVERLSKANDSAALDLPLSA